MNKTIVQFIVRLTIVLGISFCGHALLQDYLAIGSFEKHIVLTYLFNYVLTIIFFGLMIYMKEKKSNQLGFIFLFSSITKFLLFFVLIAPVIEFTRGLNNPDFAAFFVPYAISLTIEVFYLIRLLNKE
ncbi:MAG: hypothetical protein QNK23_17285 [Crocinitomicaceae bacterium]|nr:hypothetical protein [Crocinitomicaceae bacterium]